MKEATDETIIPFGLHEGKKLANVPASYLLWCEKNISPKSYVYATNREIFKYIDDNLEDLKQEANAGR
jgi:uncharacterized protein (DUF3820 family)